jgi:hypothetical protein
MRPVNAPQAQAPHSAILAAAYRAKAAEALTLACQARQDGQEAAHAGYVSEVLFWRAHADAVASREATDAAARPPRCAVVAALIDRETY